MRITTAAVSAYVVATLLFPGTLPLLAPLTAMLVVQVTPVTLIAAGLDRVVAVIAGVSLAVAFSAVLPLSWWSLGLLIFLALSIGQALRLRLFLIEVAISAMLVLGVGTFAETAAWERVAQTLVGALVGIAANLLVPPKVATSDAGRAIDGLADSLSALLNRAARDLAELVPDGHDVAPAARFWLDEARRITHDIPGIGATLHQAEQGRRLNVRAVGTPNLGPGLRQGLDSLEHCAIAIRAMFRAVADATQDARWPTGSTTRTVLLGLAETFREMAAGIDAFGQLVRNVALSGGQTSPRDVETLREALEALKQARARNEELLMTAADPVLLELHAAVLSTVKRLLSEMEQGVRDGRQDLLPHTSRHLLPRIVNAAHRRPPSSGESAAAEVSRSTQPPIPGSKAEPERE